MGKIIYQGKTRCDGGGLIGDTELDKATKQLQEEGGGEKREER